MPSRSPGSAASRASTSKSWPSAAYPRPSTPTSWKTEGTSMTVPFTGAAPGFLPSADSGGSSSTTLSTAQLQQAAETIVGLEAGSGKDGDFDLDGTNTVDWASLAANVYTCTRAPEGNNGRVR